jgi:hypothetical protein
MAFSEGEISLVLIEILEYLFTVFNIIYTTQLSILETINLSSIFKTFVVNLDNETFFSLINKNISFES